jgi:hypothetical protein
MVRICRVDDGISTTARMTIRAGLFALVLSMSLPVYSGRGTIR